MSWVVAFDPDLTLKHLSAAITRSRGIFVKNYIDQSQEFALCAVALAYPIMTLLRSGRKAWLALLLAAVALGFAGQHDVRGGVAHGAGDHADHAGGICAAASEMANNAHRCLARRLSSRGLAWTASPQLQWTTATFFRDYQIYKELDQPTSIGVRLLFWQKSLRFIAEAPVIGHGTGSTRGLFEQAATGPAVLAGGQVVSNPHNQTLHVAIQWGVLGVIVLYATWWLHLLLFRGEGLAAWIGLMVVVQNICTSLFNSHLFDFHQGWMYVLGVGVAGGMVLGREARYRNGGVAPVLMHGYFTPRLLQTRPTPDRNSSASTRSLKLRSLSAR